MIGTKVREERYIGDLDHLAALLKGLHDKGELVGMAEPVPVPHPISGQPSMMVVAQVRAPKKPSRAGAATWKRELVAWLVRNRVPIAITVAAIVVVSALGYALFLLVQVIFTHFALIVGALLVTFAVWFVLGRAGVCPGLHCPGCRHN